MVNLKTWKDCIANFKSLYYINSFAVIRKINSSKFLYENCVPSKELAEKVLIFQKLITCREAYVEDWKPDWTNHTTSKYCIINISNNIEIHAYLGAVKMFSFPNRELAEKFLNNFKESLEFIKDLL